RSGSTLSECGPPGLRARPTYPAAGPTRTARQEYCAPVISLDNPAWSSLSGAHRWLAEGNEHVLRYPADVSPFVGVRDWEHPEVWVASLYAVGNGAEVSVSRAEPLLPEGWTPVFSIPGVQLVQTDRLGPRPEPVAVELGAADSADMFALVERTRPGAFH